MNQVERWRAQLRETVERVEGGEALELEQMTRFFERARQLAAHAGADEISAVRADLDHLKRVMLQHQQALDGELNELGRRRQGIRGYGQLRSAHKGQRLRRRA